MKTLPPAPALSLAPSSPVRPGLSIARFQATLAEAVGAPGIGQAEAGFLADLQAVLNYVAALEARTSPSAILSLAPASDLSPASAPLSPGGPKPH